MIRTNAALWQEAAGRLREEIGEEDFETWFDCVHLAKVDEGVAHLKVPSDYRKDMLQGSYHEVIARVFNDLCGTDVQVRFSISEPEVPSVQESPARKQPVQEEEVGLPLSFKYTFEHFVVGESNHLAHAAAMSMAKAPAQTFNPLFFYGGVGLGKTHLLQAIGHYVLEHHEGQRVAYVTAEDFVNEFIDSIRENSRSRFQRKYRSVDVLLIDDIHFLIGKEGCQEEFFHTFNALHNRHKAIVISSDRPPKEIPTLEDRLRSRFEWGLCIDIQYPDLETRAAILRKKCEMDGINLPEEVTLFIAQRVKYSIRELEGALLKVAAHAQWTAQEATVEMAARILGRLSLRGEGGITIERIQKKVAEHFRVKVGDILGDNRSRSVTVPRQIAMYLSREMTSHSLPEIGVYFGGKDHTTVLHSFRRIEKEIAKDEDFHRFIEKLKMEIQSS